MDVSSLARLLVRRWYLTLVGLIMTVVLCVVASVVVAPTYQATADLLLLPAAKSVGPGGNPYLELGGLEQAGSVLAKAMVDSDVADSVRRHGAVPTYDIVPDARSSAPLLLITAEGTTADSALKTLRAVIALAEPTMRSIQLNGAVSVSPAYQIETSLVTSDKKASAVRKTQIRAIIGAAVAGILLTLLTVVATSRLVEGRRKKHPRAQGTGGTNETRATREPSKERVPVGATSEPANDRVSASATDGPSKESLTVGVAHDSSTDRRPVSPRTSHRTTASK